MSKKNVSDNKLMNCDPGKIKVNRNLNPIGLTNLNRYYLNLGIILIQGFVNCHNNLSGCFFYLVPGNY